MSEETAMLALLHTWAALRARDDWSATRYRNQIVQGAYAAGISKIRIHRITGIARTTIDRILKEDVT